MDTRAIIMHSYQKVISLLNRKKHRYKSMKKIICLPIKYSRVSLPLAPSKTGIITIKRSKIGKRYSVNIPKKEPPKAHLSLIHQQTSFHNITKAFSIILCLKRNYRSQFNALNKWVWG